MNLVEISKNKHDIWLTERNDSLDYTRYEEQDDLMPILMQKDVNMFMKQSDVMYRKREKMYMID